MSGCIKIKLVICRKSHFAKFPHQDLYQVTDHGPQWQTLNKDHGSGPPLTGTPVKWDFVFIFELPFQEGENPKMAAAGIDSKNWLPGHCQPSLHLPQL